MPDWLCASRSLAAIGPLVEALDTITDDLDDQTRQVTGDYLAAIAGCAGADAAELPG